MGLKESLHFKSVKPPLVSEGQLWWASLGENVGFEINGKSKHFTRPVIIFKVLSNGFYFVIPTTTQFRKGSWYVNFQLKGITETACLQQARPLDYKRLYSKVGRLDDLDFERVKEGFKNLYIQKCSPPLLTGSQENLESN